MVLALLAALVAAGFEPLARAQPADWDSVFEQGSEALAGGDLARAESSLTLAEELSRNLPANDPRRARSLISLARLHRAEGDYAKPEDLYRAADPVARAAYGPDSVEYARFLNEVGRYYHTRRKYELADQFYMQAFKLRVAALGKENVEVAESINNLAVLYENEVRLEKARVYYEHALQIRSKLLGPTDLKTVETEEHFARLLAKLQRSEEAAELASKAIAARRPRLLEMIGDAKPSPDAVRAGIGVKGPELIEQADPDYTEEARIAHHEGSVALDVEIDREGRPRILGVVKSLGLGLDENAIVAARKWRFRPARKGSEKVDYRATLEINFRLL